METNDFVRKIFSWKLWAHLLAMLLTVILLCVGVKYGLDIYTNHGKEITIPDIKHKNYADAERMLNELGLHIAITDTGYRKSLPADCILEISPVAGSKVKEGRTVYVVINSSSSPTLTIPDLIDNCSYREAKARLTAMGFQVTPPQYVNGEKDWVYGLRAGGQTLHNGQRVSVNTQITIQVGDGMRFGDEAADFGDGESVIDEYGNPAGISAEGEDDGFQVVTEPE